MRRWLYYCNVLLGLAFVGGAVLLWAAPEIVERQFHAALVRRVTSEVTSRYPWLAAVPSLEELAGSLYAQVKRLPGLARALAPTEAWAQQRYQELCAELVADLKIFASTNAVCFGLAAVAASRETHGRSTLVLSLILMVCALVGTWGYAFEQDWLQTVLTSSYYGYGYAVLVALLAGVLCDIAFNRGRVLLHLVEGFGRAVSHAPSNVDF